jgi:hypothetical protein
MVAAAEPLRGVAIPDISLMPLQIGEVIDLPEYQDCEWHTSAHVIIQLRMQQGVPAYTCWSREWILGVMWAGKASAGWSHSFKAVCSSPAARSDPRSVVSTESSPVSDRPAGS